MLENNLLKQELASLREKDGEHKGTYTPSFNMSTLPYPLSPSPFIVDEKVIICSGKYPVSKAKFEETVKFINEHGAKSSFVMSRTLGYESGEHSKKQPTNNSDYCEIYLHELNCEPYPHNYTDVSTGTSTGTSTDTSTNTMSEYERVITYGPNIDDID